MDVGLVRPIYLRLRFTGSGIPSVRSKIFDEDGFKIKLWLTIHQPLIPMNTAFASRSQSSSVNTDRQSKSAVTGVRSSGDHTKSAVFQDNRAETVMRRQELERIQKSPRMTGLWNQLKGHGISFPVLEAKNETPFNGMAGGQVIQRYSEHSTEDQNAIDPLVAARKAEKMWNKTNMSHNFALDYNNHSNYARSQSNRHSEPMVAATFLANRGGSKKLVIDSEREPCGPCGTDLTTLESEAKPKLTIEAYYFIPYTKGNGADPLYDFYHGKGEI
jgi:hypothetical protein